MLQHNILFPWQTEIEIEVKSYQRAAIIDGATFSLRLFIAEKKDWTVKINFSTGVYCYAVSHLPLHQKKETHLTGSLFVVKHSSYCDWLVKESLGVITFERKEKLLHLKCVTQEEVIDIVTDTEPILTLRT